MSQTRYAISAYETAQRTTPPLKIVVMLYDGILARIARAADAARQGDSQRQFEAVMSAARIIDGLNRHLDMEKGGDVAIRLRETYEAVARTLFRSVGKETGAEACDRLLVAVRELRDAWAEIAEADPASRGTIDKPQNFSTSEAV
ncbi:flagellar export chaperone FliS [Telmatospirillum siberiense]|uniref:Flagellar export chaperone FliS n=1 Tax=Telmatospirillum siberiense TaxID=382514 RepID=A0A2N3Q026_9PROT|nr:flagellar export chaperone FliS [Telmatospirillum siberiense]PKU25996.1 flagellar export chaperone FliS [Telmatospirillum siberiense]